MSTHSKEIWKDIPGYEGYYQASNLGRVKSLSRTRICGRGGAQQLPERILKQQLSVFGYQRINLHKDGKGWQTFVHLLVLTVFSGPRPEGKEARHLNGIRTDNRVENLQWSTHSENINDRKKHGTEVWGEANGQCRLTKEKVLEIRRLYSTGDYSMLDLANKFGVGTSTIHRVVNRIWWRWL